MEPRATPGWLVGILALALGCATHSARILTPEALRLEAAARLPELSVEDIPVLHAVAPEVVERAHREVRGAADDAERLERVIALVSDPAVFGLHYEWATTRTAAEALEHGGGNCLSLSSVLIGVARGLGLRAYYAVASEADDRWRPEADLTVASGHIAVLVYTARGRAFVDFSGTLSETRRFTPIGDLEALAHYYNNRGYERLHLASRRGEEPPWTQALVDFERAARVEPRFAEAWNNVGLALRRLGSHALAEQSYRRALALDPELISTHLNLAALYVADGAVQDALASLDAAHRIDPEHPGLDRLRALAEGAGEVPWSTIPREEIER